MTNADKIRGMTENKIWAVDKLTKEELIQAAKEIREICRRHDYYCTDCPFAYCNDEGAVNCCPFDGTPEDWEIERLERESNDS